MGRKRTNTSSGLAMLVNLGLVSAQWLEAAGIHTEKELRRLGAIETFRRVTINRAGDVTLNLLYALDGAIRGARWDKLPREIRENLRKAVDESSDV